MRPLAALVGLAALAACAPKSPPNTLDARMSGTFNWMCAGGTPATVTFHEVLALGTDAGLQIGAPTVPGASVTAAPHRLRRVHFLLILAKKRLCCKPSGAACQKGALPL